MTKNSIVLEDGQSKTMTMINSDGEGQIIQSIFVPNRNNGSTIVEFD